MGHIELSVGKSGCWTGVRWSPPGVFPALSHVKSFIRSNTRSWDGQSAQETRAETRAPVTHQPPPRPASHTSHLHIHTLHSHTYPPPLPGHTLHALSVTVAKSRAHDHDSRPPARRPNRRPYGAPLGPAQQRSPPGPDSLLRTGQTSVRASSPCQKWASPHSARAPGQLSPNRDAGFLKSGD